MRGFDLKAMTGSPALKSSMPCDGPSVKEEGLRQLRLAEPVSLCAVPEARECRRQTKGAAAHLNCLRRENPRTARGRWARLSRRTG